MKKTLFASCMILTLATGSADAVFTPLPDGNYQMTITGGCSQLGGNCQTSGFGALVDNTSSQASITTAGNGALPAGTYGSGIAGDGLMGVIDFTLIGGNLSVTSFSQDSYVSTAVGSIFLDSGGDVSGMSGSIDGGGNMVFDPTGRRGVTEFTSSSIGVAPWNLDDGVTGTGGTGLYDMWTTGSSTNRAFGSGLPFTVTGSALQDAGLDQWTGTLVVAGNFGQAFLGHFPADNMQYSELYNVTITAIESPPIGTACNVLILATTYTDELNGDITTVASFAAQKIKGVPITGFTTVTHTGPGVAVPAITSQSIYRTISQLKFDPNTFEIKSMGTCLGVPNCALQTECDSF